MEKYIFRSNSISSLDSLRTKRPGDPELDWRYPKRSAHTAQSKPAQPVKTFNSFKILHGDQNTSKTNPQLREATSSNRNSSKIPPIHIQIKPDWTHEFMKTLVSRYTKGFHFKYLGNNKLSICCHSADGHKVLQDGLRSENVHFFTYTRKDERTYKYVIFGLPTYAEEDLVGELASLGFDKASIRKLKTSGNDAPHCPPILVQLPPGSDTTAFLKIKFLSSCAVQVRKFKAKTHLGTQCYRCQSFGHTSKNCNLQPRCVKCTGSHATTDCPKKDRETPAQCCNCNESHPANYSSCSARKSYLESIERKREEQKVILSAKHLPRSATLDGRTWATAATRQDTCNHSATSLPMPSTSGLPPGQSDNTTTEMLKILSTIKSLKHQFLACHSMIDRVILILTHLGHYV